MALYGNYEQLNTTQVQSLGAKVQESLSKSQIMKDFVSHAKELRLDFILKAYGEH